MDQTLLINDAISKFGIAENYFSDILNAQIIIFSFIVGVIVTLYFLFNQRISKNYIKKEIKVVVNKMKDEIDRENEKKIKELIDKLIQEFSKHDNMITLLSGQTYRTLGQFWDSENKYSTAFIWWIRAAHSFSVTGEEKLTRIALSSARGSVEKIKLGFELNYDLIGEYQRLFLNIDDKLYRIEKDLLDKSIKDTLNNKLPTQ